MSSPLFASTVKCHSQNVWICGFPNMTHTTPITCNRPFCVRRSFCGRRRRHFKGRNVSLCVCGMAQDSNFFFGLFERSRTPITGISVYSLWGAYVYICSLLLSGHGNSWTWTKHLAKHMGPRCFLIYKFIYIYMQSIWTGKLNPENVRSMCRLICRLIKLRSVLGFTVADPNERRTHVTRHSLVFPLLSFPYFCHQSTLDDLWPNVFTVSILTSISLNALKWRILSGMLPIIIIIMIECVEWVSESVCLLWVATTHPKVYSCHQESFKRVW